MLRVARNAASDRVAAAVVDNNVRALEPVHSFNRFHTPLHAATHAAPDKHVYSRDITRYLIRPRSGSNPFVSRVWNTHRSKLHVKPKAVQTAALDISSSGRTYKSRRVQVDCQ